jgi:hypothetical protein
VDWLGGVLGLWINTPASRFLTGGFFGLVAGYFLARALVSLFWPPRPRGEPAAVVPEPPPAVPGGASG